MRAAGAGAYASCLAWRRGYLSTVTASFHCTLRSTVFWECRNEQRWAGCGWLCRLSRRDSSFSIPTTSTRRTTPGGWRVVRVRGREREGERERREEAPSSSASLCEGERMKGKETMEKENSERVNESDGTQSGSQREKQDSEMKRERENRED